MGLTSSQESSDTHVSNKISLEQLSRAQLVDCFQKQVFLGFDSSERSSILDRLNRDKLQGDGNLDFIELAQLIGFIDADYGDTLQNSKFRYNLNLIHEMFKTYGSFPFVNSGKRPDTISIGQLFVSIYILSTKHANIFPDNFDLNKLLYIALSNATIADQLIDEKQLDDQAFTGEKEDLHTVQVLELSSENGADALEVVWKTFPLVKDYNGFDFKSRDISAYSLLIFITFMLMINFKVLTEKNVVLDSSALDRWSVTEKYAMGIIRYINIDITPQNIQTSIITYSEFESVMQGFFADFFTKVWIRLIKYGLFQMIYGTNKAEFNLKSKNTIAFESNISKILFKETKLMNDSTLAFFSMVFECLGSKYVISKQNLVRLYSGADDGFSVRSFETKVFKWQAPTMLFVQGKRLRKSTISANKRYEQFSNEFPRFFRSSENRLREWQSEKDTVAYVVVSKQPWRLSNKSNFGDEHTMIFCTEPRFDFYKSINNAVLAGKSLYFNTMGFGVGVGNGQPYNKNGIKKFIPGDVSLTIEQNLEFGVFRHIYSGSASPTYFEHSKQHFASHESFEDQFMITSLEVWGMGSLEQYEQQKKQWEMEEKLAEARRTINLKSLGEERMFLEMAGLVGNHGANGGSI